MPTVLQFLMSLQSTENSIFIGKILSCVRSHAIFGDWCTIGCQILYDCSTTNNRVIHESMVDLKYDCYSLLTNWWQAGILLLYCVRQ